jgi:hypothetical protein
MNCTHYPYDSLILPNNYQNHLFAFFVMNFRTKLTPYHVFTIVLGCGFLLEMTPHSITSCCANSADTVVAKGREEFVAGKEVIYEDCKGILVIWKVRDSRGCEASIFSVPMVPYQKSADLLSNQ